MAGDEDVPPLIPKTQGLSINFTGTVTYQTFMRPEGDHPIYQLVGQVASEWAHLEHVLDTIIWALAGLEPKEGACITAQMMGAAPRYRTIITQLRNRAGMESFITKFEKLNGQTHDPQERRNRIIHDPWYVAERFGLLSQLFETESSVAQFKSMPQKDPRFGVTKVEVKAIQKTVEDIKRLSGRAEELAADIRAALSTSKQTPP